MRILTVCLGNICRSPTAEGVLRAFLPNAQIASAGTAGWHVGKPPYAPMQKAAFARGYDLSSLKAQQFTAADFDNYDLILVMDAENLSDVNALRPEGHPTPVHLMTDALPGPDHGKPVPDPYYTRDFDGALDLIERAAYAWSNQLNR